MIIFHIVKVEWGFELWQFGKLQGVFKTREEALEAVREEEKKEAV